MALRTFIDSAGQEWQAFDVVPRDLERRRYDRRSTDAAGDDDSDERRERDRRVTVGRASRRLGGSDAGWLCFEHGDDRRRLSPIPADWSRADDAQLEQYCRTARPVKRLEGKA
jgi:hypothetical protein